MKPLPPLPRFFDDATRRDSRGSRVREDIRAYELAAIGAIEREDEELIRCVVEARTETRERIGARERQTRWA